MRFGIFVFAAVILITISTVAGAVIPSQFVSFGRLRSSSSSSKESTSITAWIFKLFKFVFEKPQTLFGPFGKFTNKKCTLEQLQTQMIFVMKRIELAVMHGHPVSKPDAFLWNYFSKFVNTNYDELLVGEFESIYNGTKMRAACIKLENKENSVGFCTLKILLENEIKGNTWRHSVEKDKDLSPACRTVLDHKVTASEKPTVSSAKDRVLDTGNEIVQKSQESEESKPARKEEETKNANKPQRSKGIEEDDKTQEAGPTEGTKETERVGHAKQAKKPQKATELDDISEEEDDDYEDSKDDDDYEEDQANYCYDGGDDDGGDEDDDDGDNNEDLRRSERYFAHRPNTAPILPELAFFVDLRTLPCKPPEDLSLCSQYVSLPVRCFSFIMTVLTLCPRKCCDPDRRITIFCQSEMNCF